jgi:hypothetical protein
MKSSVEFSIIQLKLILSRLDELTQKLETIYRRNGLIVLSNEDVIRILKVSPNTLQVWRNQGLIKFSQVGKKLFYRIEDLIQFLDDHKNGH